MNDFCPCLWWLNNLAIYYTKHFFKSSLFFNHSSSTAVGLSVGEVQDTSLVDGEIHSPKTELLQEENSPKDGPFRTPIKNRRGVITSEDANFENDTDQRYIITSSPSPRISGLNNTVSKYHPSRRVSIRSTPFKQRIEDELSREENVLSEVRKKPSFHS